MNLRGSPNIGQAAQLHRTTKPEENQQLGEKNKKETEGEKIRAT